MTDARRPGPDDPRDASAASASGGGVRGDPTPSEAEFFGPEIPPSEAHDAALWEFAEETSLGIDDFAAESPARPQNVPPPGPSTSLRTAAAPLAIIPVTAVARHLATLAQSRALAVAAIASVAIVITIVLATTRWSIESAIPAQTVTVVPATTPSVRSQELTSSSTVAVSRTAVIPESTRTAVSVTRPTIQRQVPAPNLPAETQVAAPAALPVPAPIAPPVVTEPPLSVARAESPATTAVPTAPVTEGVQAERDIRLLLDAYRQSYDRLDVVSTAMLWPGVDTAALSRAFGTIASQQVEFDQCALDVLGERATARCNGSLHYVRRVGSSTPQSRSLSWAFELNRSTGKWLISRVSAQ
jgi:hypothetical protein